MSKSASLDSGEMLSTAYLREPIRTLLSARPAGLGEAMLVHLVRSEDNQPLGRVAPAMLVDSDDPWLRKVRQTCRQIGGVRDQYGVWRVPDSRNWNAA